MVRMRNLLNGNVWLWDRGKFMNRRFVMQVRTNYGLTRMYAYFPYCFLYIPQGDDKENLFNNQELF